LFIWRFGARAAEAGICRFALAVIVFVVRFRLMFQRRISRLPLVERRVITKRLIAMVYQTHEQTPFFKIRMKGHT
jgi:hypothetical protein